MLVVVHSTFVVNLIKDATIIIYDSRVITEAISHSRTVIYNRKLFIILVTEVYTSGERTCLSYNKHSVPTTTTTLVLTLYLLFQNVL